MKVVIIGTGNTAFILGRLIKAAGHSIVQVVGRNTVEAGKLASTLNSESATIEQITGNAELYILAVSDSAIESVAPNIQLSKGILVHTAGSVSMNVLSHSAKNYGILYPLQSLRKEMLDIPAVPILVDGNTEDEVTLLTDFAKSFSSQVQVANDQQRMNLHLMAILVNNFPNYLYAKAADYCAQQQVDFRLLLPLIQQTSNRLFLQAPGDTQTGPAIRRDQATIDRHLNLLNNEPELKNLYELFTQYIQAYFKKER